ncbi:MAG: tetratricopeptide repeat protein [Chloroherpetonaceae bacterium]|nr:tetratricopeptide repeat protein [Chloroherpetonaceae bacterium]MCS7212069.1 tetratricopeptide repeat protein [Chloroherpetonaceae bacterium]MDW8019948.1 tetratricopeptide repeat protein [Chloroherpetonaceae bacterium]MDW8465740.1 tetratricopeptide repeat protein [Chloroherpetonaceae bacterium]
MATENLRIAQLRKFLEKDPNDSFSRYALALELLNANQLQEAQSEFETLLQNDPNYTATYYHLGKLYEKQGHPEKAKALYEKGILLTQQQGDAHANKELREALFMLTGGDDD